MYIFYSPYYYPFYHYHDPSFLQYSQQQVVLEQIAKNQNYKTNSNEEQPQNQRSLQHQDQAVKEENQDQGESQKEKRMSDRKKRHYRKRRTNLKKKFSCKVRECQVRFSSKIALRNHLRIKHDIRMRYNKKRE